VELVDIEKLIPRDKFDFDTVNELKKLSKESLKLIIPQLFEWTQDMNWLIANDIADILINLGRDSLPEIRKILNCGDADWIYFCLSFIVSEIQLDIIEELRMELERFSLHSTEYEKLFGLDVEAKKILEKIKRE
jgi:hypothetical protein